MSADSSFSKILTLPRLPKNIGVVLELLKGLRKRGFGDMRGETERG
jgi:hypothetical protein